MKRIVPFFVAFVVLACTIATAPPRSGPDSAALKAVADEVWARELENDIEPGKRGRVLNYPELSALKGAPQRRERMGSNLKLQVNGSWKVEELVV